MSLIVMVAHMQNVWGVDEMGSAALNLAMLGAWKGHAKAWRAQRYFCQCLYDGREGRSLLSSTELSLFIDEDRAASSQSNPHS